MDQDDNGTNLLLLEDGSMIIAGYEYNPNGIVGIVRHVDNTGNPIVSFGNQGVFRYQQLANSIQERFVACASQSNGEVLILSTYENEQNKKGMYLLRLGETGVLSNVSDLPSSNNLLVFPNPAEDDIFVKTTTQQQISDLKLIDISGRLIATSTDNSSINLTSLCSGIYMLEAKVEGVIVRKPVIHN